MSEEDVRIVLQAHTEGSSLRGISRISGLAYDTVVSIVQAAAQKAQIVHNAAVKNVDTNAIGALHNKRRRIEVLQCNAHNATQRTFVRMGAGKVNKDTFVLIANANF